MWCQASPVLHRCRLLTQSAVAVVTGWAALDAGARRGIARTRPPRLASRRLCGHDDDDATVTSSHRAADVTNEQILLQLSHCVCGPALSSSESTWVLLLRLFVSVPRSRRLQRHKQQQQQQHRRLNIFSPWRVWAYIAYTSILSVNSSVNSSHSATRA